jgi:glutathione peroxidase-family protein
MGMNLLNWIFYALTIYEAYILYMLLMHMEGESSLRSAVVLPVIFLILYLLFHLDRRYYIYGVLKIQLEWNFNKILIQKKGRIACLFLFAF